jgi:hypothetical protein
VKRHFAATAANNSVTFWKFPASYRVTKAKITKRMIMNSISTRDLPVSSYILSRVRVTYKTGSGLNDWIYWHLIRSTRDYRQYSAIAVLHTLQFTVTHALGFSVFTSCILATDLSQSHCHFQSHTKSSFHSLTPFLPLFCSCQLNSFPSSSLGRLASRTRLCSQLDYRSVLCQTLPYNHFARTTQKTQPLLLRRRVYWSIA